MLGLALAGLVGGTVWLTGSNESRPTTGAMNDVDLRHDTTVDAAPPATARPTVESAAVPPTARPVYLAVVLSKKRDGVPLFILGPMTRDACQSGGDRLSAQLVTHRRREHVVSTTCAETARESFPYDDCHLSLTMKALPDLPDAHLWKYTCIPTARTVAAVSAIGTAPESKAAPEADVAQPGTQSAPAETQSTATSENALSSASAADEPPTSESPATATILAPAPPAAPAATTPAVTIPAASSSPTAATTPAAETAMVAAPADPATPPDPATPEDLARVKAADPRAAERIASYCLTANASNPDAGAACRQDEIGAWTRLVLQNEFPTFDEATRRRCMEPPLSDSYVASESCAKEAQQIN